MTPLTLAIDEDIRAVAFSRLADDVTPLWRLHAQHNRADITATPSAAQ